MSPVTIPALTTIMDRQFMTDPGSSTGPEVLFGSNQRPERVSIPALYFLQERTYLRLQTRYSLFLIKQTILLCYITNKQINSPWTWFKLERMILGPLWPLRPFYGGVSVRAASEPENAPRFLVLEESIRTRLIA